MQQLNAVQNRVNDVARSAYSGVAAATALAAMPDVDLGKTISVGIGGGMYKGYSAVAMGFTARITENVKIKGGFGQTNNGTATGVGMGYQF
ncbi:hypothetical protein WK99_12675 [Burkholderia ubonensis]|nr:hypothetical protein WK99_12675 [Burkholderia ubonensis]